MSLPQDVGMDLQGIGRYAGDRSYGESFTAQLPFLSLEAPCSLLERRIETYSSAANREWWDQAGGFDDRLAVDSLMK